MGAWRWREGQGSSPGARREEKGLLRRRREEMSGDGRTDGRGQERGHGSLRAEGGLAEPSPGGEGSFPRVDPGFGGKGKRR